MTRPRRIQYHRYGGPEVMRLEEFTPSSPGKGEILVRVRAAAGNPMDAAIRHGALEAITGRRFPRGIGHDLAGVVEAVGPEATRIKVGDEILGFAGIKTSGAFAEVVVLEEKAAVLKPVELTWEEAAVVPVPVGTAYQALLHNATVRKGQSVFISGCLGGVGRSAVAVALTQGASVSGSARSSAMADARALGVATVVPFDFDPATLAGRFDVILETSGKLPYSRAKTMLAPGGVMVDIVPTPAKFVRAAFSRRFRVQSSTADPDQSAKAVSLVVDSGLRLPVERTVSLEDAIATMTEFEQKPTPGRGKLVITMG